MMIKFLFRFTGFLFLLSLLSVQGIAQDKKVDLLSPEGHIKLSISLDDKIYYTVSNDNKDLLTKNHVTLTLRDAVLGENPQLISTKKRKGDEMITPYISLKFSTVKSVYNDLLLNFRGDYAVEFRAFNDGIAYRFITNKKSDVEVMNEDFAINFPEDDTLNLQQVNSFKTAYEEPYTHIASANWKPDDKMSTLPILISTKSGSKVLISESDVIDYPCMFLKGTGDNGAQAVFPKVPIEFGPDGDRSLKILQQADYIAKTKGNRAFPWRYFVIVKDDKQLMENTMTLRLAPKTEIADPSWIKPGQASWEWWNGATPYGPDVNFVSGFNTDTYKYFIDFASKYGIALHCNG